MNGFRLISSKAIIAELYSDFNITSDDWVHKAQRHMARGLGIMKVDGFHEIAYHLEEVLEFNAPLPCDSKYVLVVLSNSTGRITRLPLTRDVALGKDFSQIATHTIHKGTINFNSLRTNFKDGTVMYIYKRLPCDDEGNLLIPDNDDVKEALPYFLISKLSLSGYKHPVIDIDRAEAKWKELYPIAKNSMNYYSVEEAHRFTQMNNNPLYINNIDEEWEGRFIGLGGVSAASISEFVEALNRIIPGTVSTNLWEQINW